VRLRAHQRTRGTAPNHRFVLPGDGPVDFKVYARNLIELGYRVQPWSRLVSMYSTSLAMTL